MKLVNSLLKIMSLLFIVLLITTNAVSAQESAPKIIGISNHWVGNDVNKALLKIITDSLEKKGYKVISMNAEGDRKKQQNHVETLISKKVNGIIIKGGIGDDFADLARKASEADIPLIGVEMNLPDAVAAVGSPDYTYKTMSEWLTKQMGGKGKYLILTTYGWHPLNAREAFALEVMKKNPDLELIGGKSVQVGLKDPINENYEVVKQALNEHPDLKGIIATWGIPAVSAAKAVMDAGKEKQISVIGCDADDALLALMAKPDSPKIMIMGWKAEEMSVTAADLIHQAAELKNVKAAKANIVFKHEAKPFFVSNTEDSGMFDPKLMTPGDAWKFKNPDKKQPW